MARSVDERDNPRRRPAFSLEVVTPTDLNPAANQIPNTYDYLGIGEANHNVRLLKNGLHIR